MSPKVSIIIPTLSEKTKPYLDVCIESIRNLDYPQDALDIVISSPKSYRPIYEDVSTVHHPDPDRAFAEAVNYGVSFSNPDSKYIMLLSDDVIMTRDSLKNLVASVPDSNAIVNATSNCDNYWKYVLSFSAQHEGSNVAIVSRYFRLEDVKHMTKALMNAKSHYPAGVLLGPVVCFYATLIPRAVWDMVGILDEGFRTGYEDSDYCTRAEANGIPLLIQLNALVWHFGGVTTTESVTPEVAEKNKQRYFDKWHPTQP